MTSGRFRGALPWKPRFHPCGFPGAASSHSEFSSWGQGRCKADPAPSEPGRPFSLWASIYLSVPPTPAWLGLSPRRPLHLLSEALAPRPLHVCALWACSTYSVLGSPRTPGQVTLASLGWAPGSPEGWVPGHLGKCHHPHPRPAACRHSPVIQRVSLSTPSFRIPHPALRRSPGSWPLALIPHPHPRARL